MPGLFPIPNIIEILTSPRIKPYVDRLQPSAVIATTKGVIDDISQEMYSAASERRIPDLSDLIEKIISRLQDIEPGLPPLPLDAYGVLFPNDASMAQVPLEPGVIEKMIWTLGTRVDLQSVQKCSLQLCRLTGAEDALVMSCPSMAKFAIAQTFGQDHRKILIARRDLYECDRGTRLENIFRLSHCAFDEVGAVNHVVVDDYSARCHAKVGLVYFSLGSHAQLRPTLNSEERIELKERISEFSIPLLADLDFSSLFELEPYGLENVPLLSQYAKSEFDLILCRTGQLIGGPDCGVILGKKCYVDAIRKTGLPQFYEPSASRVAGVIHHLSLCSSFEKASLTVPILKTITTSLANLKNRAQRIVTQLAACPAIKEVSVFDTKTRLYPAAEAGGIPTCFLAVEYNDGTPQKWAAALEKSSPSLKGEVASQNIRFDLRLIPATMDPVIIQVLENLLSGK